MTYTQRVSSRAVLMAAAVALAACGSRGSDDKPQVDIRGTDPNAAATATAPGTPVQDGNGIISYNGYQSIVANEGETVADVAARIGLAGTALAAYNGLGPDQPLRAGDELVLPPSPNGYGANAAQSAAPQETLDVEGGAAAAGAVGAATVEQAPLDSASAAGADASIAVGSQVEPATESAWSPDLAAAAINRSTGLNEDGTLAAPPSANDPVPPEPAPSRELQSPKLSQYQTGEIADDGTQPQPPARPQDSAQTQSAEETEQAETQVAAATSATSPPPQLRLQRPVEGPVAVGFGRTSDGRRNEGVDFASTAGTPVVAAADGEVALVSQSLGGLGTIVLVRHEGDILTVYGRISDVDVSKGTAVGAGQQIGVVAEAPDGREDRMHFEVRRGPESLDPMQFL